MTNLIENMNLSIQKSLLKKAKKIKTLSVMEMKVTESELASKLWSIINLYRNDWLFIKLEGNDEEKQNLIIPKELLNL